MSLYNPRADAPRPKSMRYVFACPACQSKQQVEAEELVAAGVDFMHLEYSCTACRRLCFLTVTGESGEFKVWASPPARVIRA